MPQLVGIENLQIAFGQAGPVVSGADLAIGLGETVGLMGPSGAGKSLTAWSVTGIMPEGCTIRGTIRTFHPRTNQPLRIGQDVSIIPQNPFTSLNPAIRCGRQIGEVIREGVTNVEVKERTLNALRAMEFDDPERIYDAFPFELSGGQLQRVVIAMAIIVEPVLVIADEPTTALDTITQKQVVDWLGQWQESGQRSLLYISHDPALLMSLCDRIYFMQAGRVVEEVDKRAMETGRWPETAGAFVRHAFQRTATAANVADSGTPQPLVVVDQLSKSYSSRSNRQIRAVDAISFAIARGTTVGLVGATGCGKSTVARILAGLTRPDRGSLTFDGNPLSYRGEPAFRRRIQMIFQDPYSALYPHKTIRYFLTEPLRLHKLVQAAEIDSYLAKLMQQVQLPIGYLEKYPDQLSGGERQRVQIARALSVDPDLLICDECVTGLDLPVQASILGLLYDLQRHRDMTILFISHDLGVVRSLADRILVMSEGKIVESAPAEQIFTAPSHSVTRDLVEAIPTLNV